MEPKVSSAFAFSLASCAFLIRLVIGVYTSCSSSTRFRSSFGFWVALAAISGDAKATHLVELTNFSLDFMISLMSLSSSVSSKMVLCSCPISFSDWLCELRSLRHHLDRIQKRVVDPRIGKSSKRQVVNHCKTRHRIGCYFKGC